jgi:hypothetical protein
MSFSKPIVYNTYKLFDLNHYETQMIRATKSQSIIVSVMFKSWAC